MPFPSLHLQHHPSASVFRLPPTLQLLLLANPPRSYFLIMSASFRTPFPSHHSQQHQSARMCSATCRSHCKLSRSRLVLEIDSNMVSHRLPVSYELSMANDPRFHFQGLSSISARPVLINQTSLLMMFLLLVLWG